VSGFLLDTNFVSELVQPIPDAGVIQWAERADEKLLYLSVLTLGEIRQGVATLAQGRRRERLEAWLENDLRTRFDGRTLPVDEAIADRWGYVSARALRAGRPLPVVDGLLAATALEKRLVIVTRNERDFAGLEVDIVNPWAR
jgi:hypothetical protein